jgi:hypothetical protein
MAMGMLEPFKETKYCRIYARPERGNRIYNEVKLERAIKYTCIWISPAVFPINKIGKLVFPVTGPKEGVIYEFPPAN